MIKELLIEWRKRLRLYKFQGKWRKLNKRNYTIPTTLFDASLVKVGDYSYGDLTIRTFCKTKSTLSIGRFCSIASNVIFLLTGEHDYKCLSTYPFETNIFKGKEEKKNSKGNIIVCDDVWIGENVTILSGVTIGQGAVIGAHSLVSKDVPPYAIFAGGHIIKYRFDKETIQKLLKIDFGKINTNFFNEANKNMFVEELTFSFFDSKEYKYLSTKSGELNK